MYSRFNNCFPGLIAWEKGVLDLFSLPSPTKHFVRSYNEAGLLWNRSLKNCSHGYIHRMMAAQSKKRQKQRLIQVSSDIRLVLLNLKNNLSVKHTDLWKPTTTANPKSSYPHTHLPNPNTYHLVLEEWRALCLAPEAAMVWVTAVLHQHPQIQYYLSLPPHTSLGLVYRWPGKLCWHMTSQLCFDTSPSRKMPGCQHNHHEQVLAALKTSSCQN